MTNAEARCNKSLRPRKPEGSLGRTAQDVHLDSHTVPELCGTGVDGDPEIRVSTNSWLEKRILMPLLPRIKPATFQWHESTTLQLNYIPTPRVEPGLNRRFVLYETLGDKCQVRTPWPPRLLVKWVNLCLWPEFDGQIAIGQSAYINCWVTTVL